MTRRECLALVLLAPSAWAQSVSRLAIKGYDPVAYFTEGKPTLGKPEFELGFDGSQYRFATAGHLERFKADPDRYLPQFGGSCATGLSLDKKIESEPENWLIVDGKLYLFFGPVALDRAKANPQEVLARAHANWLAMKNKATN